MPDDRRRQRTFVPWVECLEDRCTPTTLTFTPVADNTLFEDAAGQLSNGAGQHLYAGETAQVPNLARRAVLKFDLSTVPAGSIVTDVSLSLHMSKTTSGAQSVVAHRLLKDWGEGTSNAALGGTGPGEGDGIQAATNDATWRFTFYNTQSWTTPGGDFDSAASASTSVAGLGTYTWTGAGMVADVQGWLNSSGTNFGWVLIGNESASATAKQFDSRENTTASNRPVLTVTFSPPGSDLTIAKSHTGTFTQGDPADTYTLTVSNAGGSPTSGVVTVTDTLPAGLTP